MVVILGLPHGTISLCDLRLHCGNGIFSSIVEGREAFHNGLAGSTEVRLSVLHGVLSHGLHDEGGVSKVV